MKKEQENKNLNNPNVSLTGETSKIMEEVKTGNKKTDNLYKSVIEYIEKNNGKVIVIGGVSIIELSGKYKYGLVIKITGKKPKFNK